MLDRENVAIFARISVVDYVVSRSMNAPIVLVVVAVGVLLLSAFFDRVLIPYQARRIVENLLKRKPQHDPRALENPEYGTVVGGADCLRIQTATGDASELPWSEIEEIHAYKRDLLTTDLTCLLFKKSGVEEYYEIHEEMAGYHDLIEQLGSRLPNFTLDWFCDVAFPAFDTNHRIIWRR